MLTKISFKQTCITNNDVTNLNSYLTLHSLIFVSGLLYSTLTLLGTVVFLLAATHVNGWKLTKKLGIVLMIVYLLFTVLTALYELNIFGYVHPKECKTNY